MKSRSLSVCLLLLSLLFSTWLQAAVELNDNVPETYIVKKGTRSGVSPACTCKSRGWPTAVGRQPQIDNPT